MQTQTTRIGETVSAEPSTLRQHFFRSVGQAIKCHKLGTLLLGAGLVTQEELDSALAIQKKTGEPLGKVLIAEGMVSAVQIYRKLAEQWCLKATAAGVAMMMMAPTAAHASERGLSPQFQMAAAAVSPRAYRAPVQETAEQYPALFGTREVRSSDISAFTKWTRAMHRFESEMKAQSSTAPRIMLWKAALRDMRDMNERAQIEAVNDYANQMKYIEDKDNYKKSDYWATPTEFFSRGGDCEDFAIAKYASFRALGYSADRLRIVIVQDLEKGLKHAVLAVYTTDGDVMILDNQDKRARNANRIDRYEPIFSINSSSWWLHRYADS